MLGFGDDIHILQVMYTRMYRCTAAQQAACPSVNVLAGTGVTPQRLSVKRTR